jgi:hypothetical protein
MSLLLEYRIPRSPYSNVSDAAWLAAREKALETFANPTDEQIYDVLVELEFEWASADDEIYPEVCA